MILDQVWDYDFGSDASIVESLRVLPPPQGGHLRTAHDPNCARRGLLPQTAEGWRSMHPPKTLRFRLVAAVVVLVAAALTVSGLVAVTSGDYLVGQVDRQLIELADGPGVTERPPSDLPQFSPGIGTRDPNYPPTSTSASSTTAAASSGRTRRPGPLAGRFSITAAKVRSEQGRPFSVPGQAANPAGGWWRLRVRTAPGWLPCSLGEVDSIVARLSLLLLLGIGLIVLVIVAVVGYFIVRRSLAPLVEVGGRRPRLPTVTCRVEYRQRTRAPRWASYLWHSM